MILEPEANVATLAHKSVRQTVINLITHIEKDSKLEEINIHVTKPRILDEYQLLFVKNNNTPHSKVMEIILGVFYDRYNDASTEELTTLAYMEVNNYLNKHAQ